MSAHSEIVRDYVELRNYLAQSHPQPNVEFEIHFKIQSGSLLAFSSVSKASVELAKIQPTFFRLFLPHYGLRFEKYSVSLINYVNEFPVTKNDKRPPADEIIRLCVQHRKNLNLKSGYEPMN